MADWNPSEIIGNNPNLLDYSLYDYLIMSKSWYLGRNLLNYQTINDSKLMKRFGNKPYVDVNLSFDSLIPNNINKKTRKKLLKFYLDKLSNNPFLHDKVEFQILFTCSDPSLNSRIRELKKYSFSNDEIETYLTTNHIKYEFLETKLLLEKTSKLISEGNVVGWFQGKMEWGPRALGNRSILADPRRAEMKDVLNEKIKHRESFRPFAQSILEEHVSEYFELDIPSPYMLLVAKIKKPEKIPAVTHVDGTGRLQSVSRDVNPLYYDLIDEFYKITDVPVIINTSMNVMGEPIVNTPEQTYSMIQKTDMDYLIFL